MHPLYIWAQLLIKLSKQLHEKNILCQNLSFFLESVKVKTFWKYKFSREDVFNVFQVFSQ